MMKKITIFILAPALFFLMVGSLILLGGENGTGNEPGTTNANGNGNIPTELVVRLPYRKGVTPFLTQGYWTNYLEAVEWWGSITPPYASGMHRAVDYSTGGGTEIMPSINGTVVVVNNGGGFGNYVIVETTIKETSYYFLYAHFSQHLINQGAFVDETTPLGIEGNTGLSFGAHVHVEISTKICGEYLCGDERINFSLLPREE